MADYIARTRTNYFAVTDRDKFLKVIRKCHVDGVTVLTPVTLDNEPKVGFYCQGSIEGYPVAPEKANGETDVYDIDAFLNDLSDTISPGDACIITEIGFESMRSFNACYTIVAPGRKIKCMDPNELAKDEARALLNNPEWETRMSY